VGIADPVHPGVIVRTVVGAGPLGIATSGTSQRGAHIIDPHTGTRQEALASVTVVTDDVVRADVLATAAVAMGEDGIVWLAGLTDVRSIVVRGDGSVSAAWRGQEPT
jgi:thiamine biosynthesis lipoprotein